MMSVDLQKLPHSVLSTYDIATTPSIFLSNKFLVPLLGLGVERRT